MVLYLRHVYRNILTNCKIDSLYFYIIQIHVYNCHPRELSNDMIHKVLHNGQII